MIEGRTRIALNPSVLLSPSDTGYVAYNVSTDRLQFLNPSASLIAELCAEPRSVDELRDALEPLLPEGLWPSCATWLEEAIDSEFLQEVGGAARLPPPLTADELCAHARALRDRDAVLPAFVCQEHALALGPDDPDGWAMLGELAHILGRRAEAREAYERSLALRPGDVETEHILISLRGEPPPERASVAYVTRLYSRFASFYDENMVGELEYRGPAIVGNLLDRALGSRVALRALDLGCGTGLGGPPLRERARHLVGVDLSADMVDLARRRGVYDALHVGDVVDWLARDDGEPYDVILALDLLIYFGDLRQVLVPAARRLAPGGCLGLTVERGETSPFLLTDSGRFAHHRDHIVSASRDAGLVVTTLEDACLRYEFGEPVRSWVAVLARPA